MVGVPVNVARETNLIARRIDIITRIYQNFAGVLDDITG